MATPLLKERFQAVAGAHDGAVLTSPGVEGLYILLRGTWENVTQAEVEQVYTDQSWARDQSLSWEDWLILAGALRLAERTHSNTIEKPLEVLSFRQLAVERVRGRLLSNAFPAVSPLDLEEESEQKVAEETCEFALNTDHDRVRAYVAQKYDAHIQDHPEDEDVESDARRASWYLDHFYRCCRDFWVEEAVEGGDLIRQLANGRLLPLMPVQAWGTEDKNSMPWQLLQNVSAESVPNVHDTLKQKWKDVLQMLPYTQLSKRQLFEQFIHTDYIDTLRVALSTPLPPSCVMFRCLYDVAIDGVDAGVIAQRKLLIAEAQVVDEAKVESLLEAQWETMCQKMPLCVRASLSADAFTAYHQQHYFNVLRSVVDERKAVEVQTQKQLEPKVPPEEGVSSEVCAAQQRLLEQLSQDDLDEVAFEVERQWTNMRDDLPAYVQCNVPATAPEEYWVEHYYATMFSLHPWRPKHADTDASIASQEQGRAASRDESFASTAQQQKSKLAVQPVVPAGLPVQGNGMGVGMVGLLRAGPVAATAPAASQEKLEYISSAQILQKEFTGTRWKYEGFIIDFDAEPRVFTPRIGSPSKRMMADAIENKVLDVMLGDLTGPTKVTLWGQSVEEFLSLVKNASDAAGVEHWKYVLLESVRISEEKQNDFNGNVLTSMRGLHSMVGTAQGPSTAISLVTSLSSPFMTTAVYATPSSVQCIINFSSCRSKMVPPFRATMRGVILDLADHDVTQQGDAKRAFALVDDMGFWCHVIAIGRNALSPALENGNDVVLYFVTARPGSHGGCGSVYLFKDSVIVLVGKKYVQKRVEIELCAKPL